MTCIHFGGKPNAKYTRAYRNYCSACCDRHFCSVMSMLGSGPFWFGVVIGFVTYRTLKHKKDAGISDIASVVGAVGGATIIKLFPTGSERFDHYAMGFAVGFFLFLIVLQWLAGSGDYDWKRGEPPSQPVQAVRLIHHSRLYVQH